MLRRTGSTALLVLVLASLAAGSAHASVGVGATVDGPDLGTGGVAPPVAVPINLCGNTIDIVGLLNPASGNTCVTGDAGVGTPGAAAAAVKRSCTSRLRLRARRRSACSRRAAQSDGDVTANFKAFVPLDAKALPSQEAIDSCVGGGSVKSCMGIDLSTG